MSGHLVHGMGTALEAPTWPVITPNEAEATLARFPEAGRLEQLSWHSPRPFSAATLARAEGGEFLLKRHHPRLRSVAALTQEHAFMAHLQAAGLSIPQVMASSDGATAIAEGGWTYELHRKATGRDLYRDRLSWTPFLSHDHAFAAGEALARLHIAAKGFAAPARATLPLIASFTILPASDPLAATQAYVDARPALARFLADKPWQGELAHLFEALDSGLAERLRGQEPLWTHNDWHPSNLLWSASAGVTTIFDFGLTAQTCALYDLATALERTTVGWLALGEGSSSLPVDGGAARRLLAGYQTRMPLCRRDIETIIRLLPLVHLEFALSEVDYFAGIVGDIAQAQLAWQGYALGHAKWFLSPPGAAFLLQLEATLPCP